MRGEQSDAIVNRIPLCRPRRIVDERFFHEGGKTNAPVSDTA
jgi:hypothetical protein